MDSGFDLENTISKKTAESSSNDSRSKIESNTESQFISCIEQTQVEYCSGEEASLESTNVRVSTG